MFFRIPAGLIFQIIATETKSAQNQKFYALPWIKVHYAGAKADNST